MIRENVSRQDESELVRVPRFQSQCMSSMITEARGLTCKISSFNNLNLKIIQAFRLLYCSSSSFVAATQMIFAVGDHGAYRLSNTRKGLPILLSSAKHKFESVSDVYP